MLPNGCARRWRKRTKADLIDMLVELAERRPRSFSGGSMRDSNWKPRLKNLPRATRQAIADATDFDERDINRNFDYDYAAYDEVKRNLSRLIDWGSCGWRWSFRWS